MYEKAATPVVRLILDLVMCTRSDWSPGHGCFVYSYVIENFKWLIYAKEYLNK